MKMENIIELKHIAKKYGDSYAVKDFNLDVERGEFVTFLGPSGCGKTTTLRMIAGFEVPSEGKILLNGKDISLLPPNERPVNTVFQRYALFPHLNVYDNVAFGLKIKKFSKAEIKKKVDKALEIVDLADFGGRNISTLSGGQQQRVAIARAIVNEPEILLLDEPLGALDLKMRQEMQLELKAMHERLGITFIYVTHDQEEALTMSDKIVVISEGEIQQVGTPEEIYNEPTNAFVADFIGESNIFTGIMLGKKAVRFLGAEFECGGNLEKGTQVDVVIRPENVSVTSPKKGTIKGEVISVVFKGALYEMTIQSGKYEIVVQSVKKKEVGDQVGIEIDPEDIHLMPTEIADNKIEVGVDKNYKLDIMDGRFYCDMARLMPGSKFNSDGELLDENDEVIDPDKLRVIISVSPDNIEMSDNVAEGFVKGHIIDLIYKGDHYSYVVRTDDDCDYVVHDEDLWNMDDYVSLVISEENVKYSVRKLS